MDIHSHSAGSRNIILFSVSAFIGIFALPFGTAAQTQQRPQLSAAYAKAARTSLLAIEADASVPQDETSETVATEEATAQTIASADAKAATNDEAAVTEMLREIYQLKLHDNGAMKAFQVLMDIENTPEDSDNLDTRKKKNNEASQFADGQAAITSREDSCFRQLEQTLAQRSVSDVTACSQWIQKAKASEKRFSRVAENW